ncbi:ABC transporter substrate-binding protein [Lentzea aerocolonigenes]|uniref:ABC transporter substrate-binding protein n=1 Tax=Lentzea aerocolonigenes TaxID=68170 RepID=UPI000A7F6682|nr:ABC transporter substrate-binding protein [Lentzea aerocolonigenes]
MTRTKAFPARAAALLWTGALVLTAAGCGGGSDDSSASDKSFTYWSMWKENEPQAKVLAQAVTGFERDTGIHVEVQWQGRDVLKKVVPALRGGDVPDLIDQEQNKVQSSLVSSDQFRDLTGVYGAELPGSGRKVSDVLDAKNTEQLKKDGKAFLVPYEVIGHGLWFNGAALPDVVKTPPKSWDELAAVFAKRKAEGRAPIALDADIASYNSYWTIGALQGSLGAGKVRDLAGDKSGKAWDTPEVREGLARVKDLVDKGYFINGYDGSKWPAVQEKWAQGQADFLLMGSWAPSEVGGKAAPGFQFHFTPLPGAKNAVPASTIGFAIPKPAKHAAPAEKFIAYFLKDENLAKIATETGNLTPNPALPAPEALKGLADALKTMPVSRPYDGIDQIPGYVDEVFHPVSDQLIKGKTDVAGFLSQLAEKQANYWKKNG